MFDYFILLVLYCEIICLFIECKLQVKKGAVFVLIGSISLVSNSNV